MHDDLTLVDLHYALQSAFGWDDSTEPRGKSACARLDELDLREGQQIAYVFDFGEEWRVGLTLKEKRPADGRVVARCIEKVGAAPPQYARG